MRKNTLWMTSVCWSLFLGIFCLLTSCLKSGDESISLQSGEADELILGEWKVVGCTFTYVDSEGNAGKVENPENIQWGNLLQPEMIVNFDFSGTCTIDHGTTTFPYSIDAIDQIFQLKGNTYKLVSIGKNLLVVKISATLNLPNGTSLSGQLDYQLVRMAGGNAGDDGTGIPADSKAEPNPVITGDYTATIPNVQLSTSGGVVTMDMTGVQDLINGGWLKLYGTGLNNQNIWIEVDDTPKGIVVVNSDENDGSVSKRMVDLVFLIDNSGSMGEEADGVANGIMDWASSLESSGLDIKFGCVGYGRNVGSPGNTIQNNWGVVGALDISSYVELSNYLNRIGKSGCERTVGYAGANATELAEIVDRYFDNGAGECGGQALYFADKYFSFRPGSNRIYVNFTDTENYPGGMTNYSVEYVKEESRWSPSQGTIHTVYSGGAIGSGSTYYKENPLLFSTYTGGTIKEVPSNFSGVDLNDLPVTGALTNSYVIKFRDPGDTTGGTHKVRITIKDGRIQAERIFNTSFN